MIQTFKTAIWHNTAADGALNEDHCCGCWHISLDSDAPDKPYAQCNECGEVRVFKAVGVSPE